jgi:hypothetical protein
MNCDKCKGNIWIAIEHNSRCFRNVLDNCNFNNTNLMMMMNEHMMFRKEFILYKIWKVVIKYQKYLFLMCCMKKLMKIHCKFRCYRKLMTKIYRKGLGLDIFKRDNCIIEIPEYKLNNVFYEKICNDIGWVFEI